MRSDLEGNRVVVGVGEEGREGQREDGAECTGVPMGDTFEAHWSAFLLSAGQLCWTYHIHPLIFGVFFVIIKACICESLLESFSLGTQDVLEERHG